MRNLLVGGLVVLALAARTGATTSYTTTFPLTENPISEVGGWTNGRTVGVDWSDVRTAGGMAFGTQSGVDGYNDSLAVLPGTWASDQTAAATVYTVNQTAGDVWEEAEILLRFKITPHSARGYEINFSMRNNGTQYTQIVRWNGPLGDWTPLYDHTIPNLQTGDRVAASIVGSTITTYINDVEIFHVTDSTFTDGNPGLGFFMQKPQGDPASDADYGFSCYAAADDGVVPSCAAAEPGRMTGGGRVVTPTGPVTLAFELRCQPSGGASNLEVVWSGGRFTLDTLTTTECYQDPSIASATVSRGKGQPAFNTYLGQGTGRLKNGSAASATWSLTDQGEPGRNDTVAIQIRDRNNVVVLSAAGRLADGNNASHK